MFRVSSRFARKKNGPEGCLQHPAEPNHNLKGSFRPWLTLSLSPKHRFFNSLPMLVLGYVNGTSIDSTAIMLRHTGHSGCSVGVSHNVAGQSCWPTGKVGP